MGLSFRGWLGTAIFGSHIRSEQYSALGTWRLALGDSYPTKFVGQDYHMGPEPQYCNIYLTVAAVVVAYLGFSIDTVV
jgi:hypothetical protein